MTGHARRLIGRWVAVADRVIGARDEEIARRVGWQVTRAGFGARTYRDPRFNRPAPAPAAPVSTRPRGDR